MSLLSDSLKTAASQTKAETADDGAAIGRAALKKARQENTASLTAALESHRDNGRAKTWTRRVVTSTMADNESGRELREVTMIERADAYGSREFLRMANKAAATALPNGWRNAEAVESLGAELVSRILAKTAGRMPKRGSLGRSFKAENPDFAYLVSVAKFCAADAGRGDALVSEIAPQAAADGVEGADLAALAAEAVESAEIAPDPYLCDPIAPRGEGPAALPRGDFLTERMRGKVKRLAVETGRRPASVTAATVAAIRPALRAADWADADYAKTAGAFRKAAHTGRAILCDAFTCFSTGPRTWTAADWRRAEAVALLAEEDRAERETRHIGEALEIATYRAPAMNWPPRKVEPAAYRVISTDSLLDYPSGALK